MHRVARPNQDPRLGGPSGLCRRRLAGGQDQASKVIGCRHLSLENGNERLVRLDPDHELRAFDRGVEIRRIDREPSRLAAKGLKGPENQAKQGRLFLLLRDAEKTQGRIFVDSQDGIIDQRHGGTAARADPDCVALAHGIFQLGTKPSLVLGALDLDPAFERDELPAHALARLGSQRPSCNQQNNNTPPPIPRTNCAMVMAIPPLTIRS